MYFNGKNPCSYILNYLLVLTFLLAGIHLWATENESHEFILEGNFPQQTDLLHHSFSKNFLAQIAPLLKDPSLSNLLYIEKFVKGLNPQDQKSLLKLGLQDLNLKFQSSGRTVINSTGLYSHELLELKKVLYKDVAETMIDNLLADPHLHYRVLSRDMDELYAVIQKYLHPENTDLHLSDSQKLNLMNRMALIPFSRKLVHNLIERKDRDLFLATIKWAPHFDSIKNQSNSSVKLELIDIGYFGSIVNALRPFLDEIHLSEIKFRFFWKDPEAPKEILTFPLTNFNQFIKNQYPFFLENNLQKLVYPEPEDQSFRVGAIEHGPKLLSGFEGVRDQSITYLASDVDNTLLIDVPINEFRNHPKVQTLLYQPSPSTTQKYKERLAHAELGKIIHYRFIDDHTIESTVVLRPEFIKLLRNLKPLLDRNSLKGLLISANDYLRTKAVVEQIKIDGRTLEEWGFIAIDPKDFIADGKSIDRLREKLEIKETDSVVVIDDADHAVVSSRLSNGNDVILGLPLWEAPYSNDYLEGKDISNFNLKDSFYFQRIFQILSQLQFRYRYSSNIERLRTLAQYMVLTQGSASDELREVKNRIPSLARPGKLSPAIPVMEIDLDPNEQEPYEISEQELILMKQTDQSLRMEQIQKWQRELTLFIESLNETVDDGKGTPSANLMKLLQWVQMHTTPLNDGITTGWMRQFGISAQAPPSMEVQNNQKLKKEEVWLAVLSMLPSFMNRRNLKPFDLFIILSRLDQVARPSSFLLKILAQLDRKSALMRFLLRDPGLQVTETLLWAQKALKITITEKQEPPPERKIPTAQQFNNATTNLFKNLGINTSNLPSPPPTKLNSHETLERNSKCYNLF